MIVTARRLSLSRSSALALAVGMATVITGCTSPGPGGRLTSSKEYFAESEYGVKASPRVVSNLRSRMPRGGGRDVVGKPYKVKGKWYRPRVDPDYQAVGAASWYGDAFHGRLTANGEVYDMHRLTAAHPTMPLPSYARVTNLKNGSSVVVRVNDRGPFEKGRIIDLSKEAAKLLDYAHAGVAKVKVEYVGRAPLHGHDDQFLVASYRPGKGGAPGMDDGLPAGVMVAMAGRTPNSPVSAPAFPVATRSLAPLPPVAVAATGPQPIAARAAQAISSVAAGDPSLPDIGPELPERPGRGVDVTSPVQVASLGALSYADERVVAASQAFSALDASSGLSPDAIVASWKRMKGTADVGQGEGDYVAAGTFGTRDEAGALATRLAAFGRVSIEADAGSFSVVLATDGRGDIDELVRHAWENGAPDAFIVHD